MVTPAPRRLRTARPDGRAPRLTLSEADLVIFTAIDRHGPLPSSYLYEFTRHLRRDRTHLQNRLTEFYNGDMGGNYLTRPPQQFAAYEARYQHLVYDLTPRSRLLLSERGLRALGRARRSDPFVHRLMCACVGASFELSAAAHGLRYIPAKEILVRQGAVERDDNGIEPDLLFGFEYPGHGFRFFAVECDRQTESIERRNLRQSAFARKLDAYNAMLAGGTYRTRWGVPNLHILTVTTSARHADNILTAVRTRVDSHFHAAFAVASDMTFGANWKVPKAPLPMLNGLWRTVAGVRDFRKPKLIDLRLVGRAAL